MRAGGVAGGAHQADRLADLMVWPWETRGVSWWQYQISVPSSSVRIVRMPYGAGVRHLGHDAVADGDQLGPVSAPKSRPVWMLSHSGPACPKPAERW